MKPDALIFLVLLSGYLLVIRVTPLLVVPFEGEKNVQQLIQKFDRIVYVRIKFIELFKAWSDHRKSFHKREVRGEKGGTLFDLTYSRQTPFLIFVKVAL